MKNETIMNKENINGNKGSYLLRLTLLIFIINYLFYTACSSEEEYSTDVEYDLDKPKSFVEIPDESDLFKWTEQSQEFVYNLPQKIDVIILLNDYELLRDRYEKSEEETELNLDLMVPWKIIEGTENYVKNNIPDERQENIDINYMVVSDFPDLAKAHTFYQRFNEMVGDNLENSSWLYINPLPIGRKTSKSSSEKDKEDGEDEDTFERAKIDVVTMLSMSEPFNTLEALDGDDMNILTYENSTMTLSERVKIFARKDALIIIVMIPTRTTKVRALPAINDALGSKFSTYKIQKILTERYDLILAENVLEVYTEIINTLFVQHTQIIKIHKAAAAGVVAIRYFIEEENQFELDKKSYSFIEVLNAVQIFSKIPLDITYNIEYVPVEAEEISAENNNNN